MGIFSKKNKDGKPAKVEEKAVEQTKATEKPKAKTAVKAKTSKKVANIEKVATKIGSEAHKVLLRPIISEKATVGAALNKYVFEVSGSTNKVEIKKAINEIYGVVPAQINVINQRGKNVRFGRHWGTTKSVKKAVVTLKKGDSIKLYEGI